MEENTKTALLAGMLDAMVEEERKGYFEYANLYAGLAGLTYNVSGQKGYSKSQMTNKQKKSRAASKRAKKSS
jgi:hypothetical protein